MVKKHIPAITSLRGYAAFMVALFHFMPHVPVLFYWLKQRTVFFERAYLWVDFFFILSGFILFVTYGEHFHVSGCRANYKNFLIARFSRIYPLHIFVLLFMLATIVIKSFITGGGVFQPPFFTQETFWYNVFMLQSLNLYPYPSWNMPAWSISLEWWAYVLFPLFVWGIFQRARWVLVLAALACFSVLAALIHFYHHLDVTVQNGFIRSGAEFLLGGIVFRLTKAANGFQFNSLVFFSVFIIVNIAVGWAVFVYSELLVVALFATLIFVCVNGEGWFLRFVDNKVFTYLGDLSYSVYMVHVPILIYLDGGLLNGQKIHKMAGSFTILQSILVVFAYLALLIVISMATYHGIENPARKWGRSWLTDFSRWVSIRIKRLGTHGR